MRKSGLTGDEAYVLSKHGKTTEDLGPLKKEIGLIKEDIEEITTKDYVNLLESSDVISIETVKGFPHPEYEPKKNKNN